MEDFLGNLWVGSNNNGIFAYNPRTRRVTHYQQTDAEGSLRGSAVLRIFQDSRKRIWVGTNGGGLNLFYPNTRTFKSLTVKDGLPNNAVKGIMEDGLQNLWLATNEGQKMEVQKFC